MKSRSRTIITRVIVFLLLGAIVNVAVAWGCALLVSHPQDPNLDYFVGVDSKKKPGWYIMGWQHYGSVQILSDPIRGEHVASDPVFLNTLQDTDRFPPAWSRINEPPASGDSTLIEDGRGMPLIALRCEYSAENLRADEHESQRGIKLSRAPLGNGPFVWLSPRALPLMPVWPGFAINTIFYAAILWVLWTAPGPIRRFIRVKRHRCAACGYRIAQGVGPVCSECGHPLTRQPGS